MTSVAHDPPKSAESETMVRHYEYDTYDRLLDEDGFVVWPKLIPPDVIDAHLAGLDEVMRQAVRDPSMESDKMSPEVFATLKRERSRFHREHEAALALLFNRQLIDCLGRRFGETPVMRQPQTGYYQQHTPAHTESLDIKPHDSSAEVRVWCALEDVDPEAGVVYYVPRSHTVIAATLEDRLSRMHPEFLDTLKMLARHETTLTEYGEAVGEFFRNVRLRILPQLVEEAGLKRVAPVLEKGDVVVFRSDVVHGTSACSRPERTRKYLTAFWSARSTRWFQTRAWWGPQWDHRCEENGISAPIEDLALGSRIEFSSYQAAYRQSFARPVHVSPACIS